MTGSPSARHRAELAHTALTLLGERPDGKLSRQEILRELPRRLDLPPEELEDDPKRPGRPRYQGTLLTTIALARAGWLKRSHGIWQITPDGRKALAAFPEPRDFIREARRLARLSTKRESRRDVEATLEDLRKFTSSIDPDRIAYRRKAEGKARSMVERSLGQLDEDGIRQVFRTLNSDLVDGAERSNRFAPAFQGKHVNETVDALDATNRWISRLWTCDEDDAPDVLEEFWSAAEIPSSGRSLPTGVLYLRNPDRFQVMMPTLSRAVAHLTNWKLSWKRSAEAYAEYNEAVTELRDRLGSPPQAMDLILWKALRLAEAPDDSPEEARTATTFEGFSEDTFRFFVELKQHNNHDWFEANRRRYRESIREPLRQLVADLAERFVRRVDPSLEDAPKSPNTLSSIHKNAYGREENPYWPHFWAAFHRREHKKTADFQLSMYVSSEGFSSGMYFGSAPKDDLERFRDRARRNSDLVTETIGRALEGGLGFRRGGDDGRPLVEIRTADELADALDDPILDLQRIFSPDEPLLMSPDLVVEVDRLYSLAYPLYALAIKNNEEEAVAALRAASGSAEDEIREADDSEAYSLEELQAECLLTTEDVTEIEALLSDKRQVIFYGPPGTGKTWLAERFAKYWIGTKGDVTTVQFHPSYSYEDFVEGFRPDLDVDSGQVRYRVVPGVFRRLCETARKNPDGRYVLVIDEINRGNLARIFGELLYLLERRGEEVDLPVSRQSFVVPRNIYILGTMNTADHSIALLDMALRRRFHFKRFDPDPELLRDWLHQYRRPMTWVAGLLERLNRRLHDEGVDPDRFIGHSHFMHRELDPVRLERVWRHSVLPAIEEFFYGQRDRVSGFSYEAFVEKEDGSDGDSSGDPFAEREDENDDEEPEPDGSDPH